MQAFAKVSVVLAKYKLTTSEIQFFSKSIWMVIWLALLFRRKIIVVLF